MVDTQYIREFRYGNALFVQATTQKLDSGCCERIATLIVQTLLASFFTGGGATTTEAAVNPLWRPAGGDGAFPAVDL